jgi:hypothetical protein
LVAVLLMRVGPGRFSLDTLIQNQKKRKESHA